MTLKDELLAVNNNILVFNEQLLDQKKKLSDLEETKKNYSQLLLSVKEELAIENQQILIVKTESINRKKAELSKKQSEEDVIQTEIKRFGTTDIVTVQQALLSIDLAISIKKQEDADTFFILRYFIYMGRWLGIFDDAVAKLNSQKSELIAKENQLQILQINLSEQAQLKKELLGLEQADFRPISIIEKNRHLDEIKKQLERLTKAIHEEKEYDHNLKKTIEPQLEKLYQQKAILEDLKKKQNENIQKTELQQKVILEKINELRAIANKIHVTYESLPNTLKPAHKRDDAGVSWVASIVEQLMVSVVEGIPPDYRLIFKNLEKIKSNHVLHEEEIKKQVKAILTLLPTHNDIESSKNNVTVSCQTMNALLFFASPFLNARARNLSINSNDSGLTSMESNDSMHSHTTPLDSTLDYTSDEAFKALNDMLAKFRLLKNSTVLQPGDERVMKEEIEKLESIIKILRSSNLDDIKQYDRDFFEEGHPVKKYITAIIKNLESTLKLSR